MKKHTCGHEMGTCRGVSYCWHCMVPEEPFGPFRLFTPEAVDKAIAELYKPPKPATPEPPEWKEPFDPNATMYPSDFVVSPHVFVRKAHDVSDCHYCGASRFGPMACQPCPGGTIGNPPPSPLDRALEDFTARRKAKREKSDIEEFFEGSQWTADEVERLKALNEQLRQDRLLCEAMSTPLPHDPPMSARLMPWRGKE